MRVFLFAGLFYTSLSFAQWGEGVPLNAENLKFTYQNFDGDRYVPCTHEVENVLSQDWKVICEKENFKREYSVHLWVTRYTKAAAPKTSFEILYWVSEKYPQQVGHSTTNWIHLAEESHFVAASLSVGVDSESSGLYLDITQKKSSPERH